MRFSDIFDPATKLGRVPAEVYGYGTSFVLYLCAVAAIYAGWL